MIVFEEFQSLFFWIPLFRVVSNFDDLPNIRVSILVFLDTSVPGGSVFGVRVRCLSFNPCFSGYLCSGAVGLRGLFDSVAVSILVFLDTSVPGVNADNLKEEAAKVSILVFLDTSVPGKRVSCV